MVHGIPTLFGDADDVAMSLPDLKAAVDDCARAGKSSPILFKETQLTVHASAWVRPIGLQAMPPSDPGWPCRLQTCDDRTKRSLA